MAKERPGTHTALITGVTGQDGWYLAQHLSERGDTVWGLTRSGEVPVDLPFVRPLAGDVLDALSLERTMEMVQPDRVYHLAARTSVAESWVDPVETGDATGLGAARVLAAVQRIVPEARVFLASSSEIFGEPAETPQDERTPIRPVSPYGAAKAYAHHLGQAFRRHHGLFVALGILYNHESPRRPAEFVTRKITRAAVAIARGEQTELRLGNLDAVRDWGFAGDHVRAMRLMLEADEPDDLVIATGQAHTVRDWCEQAFARVGLDYREHVVTDPDFWRPAELVPLVGNPARAAMTLGWRPEVGFDQLVAMLVDADGQQLVD